MSEDQKETAVIIATVATVFVAALAVGKAASAVTRVTMPRKFNKQVDKQAAEALKK